MAAQVFSNFGDRAHLAVVLADREARAVGHPLVDTQHLLIGLVDGDPAVARIMSEAGVSGDDLRAAVTGVAGADVPLARGETMFTDALNTVLRGAGLFARRREREVSGTDLLIEVLDQGIGGAPAVLARLGVETVALRRAIAGAPTGGPAGARAGAGTPVANVRRLLVRR